MDKKHRPPSRTRHDYMSLGPYWWPNPEKPDGKPYVRRDGWVNPEVAELDGYAIRNLVTDLPRLLLAARLLQDQESGRRVVLQLRRWFLNKKTAMNPHLRYGQGIPGICEGRGIGLIDTSGLCGLFWQMEWAGRLKGWTERDDMGLREWFRQYLAWMRESNLGRKEQAELNNHGTWYDAQVCAFAAFLGEQQIISEQLQRWTIARIMAQIAEDGSMPHELGRTLPVHYSVFNFTGFLFCALHGERVGCSLLDEQTEHGRRLVAAAAWIGRLALGREAVHGVKPFDSKTAVWALARMGELKGDGPWTEALAEMAPPAWERDLYRHMRTDSEVRAADE